MKLLLDQGLARSTVGLLTHAGVQAEHVWQLGMTSAQDELILAHAKSHGSIVVTIDGDFHAILARNGAASPSVIRLRVEHLKAEGQARMLLQVLGAAAKELEQGAVVTADQWSVRARLLPIGGPGRERLGPEE